MSRSRGSLTSAGRTTWPRFFATAQKEGLYVVLRPGPYVCAEWDLGGYPAWLLKESKTRDGEPWCCWSTQPQYLAAVRQWMMRLGKELAPLQASRGGPIIAVQVENEYGSFKVAGRRRRAYMRTVEQMVRDAGFGGSLLYTADGAEELPKGSLPDLPGGDRFWDGRRGALDCAVQEVSAECAGICCRVLGWVV